MKRGEWGGNVDHVLPILISWETVLALECPFSQDPAIPAYIFFSVQLNQIIRFNRMLDVQVNENLPCQWIYGYSPEQKLVVLIDFRFDWTKICLLDRSLNQLNKNMLFWSSFGSHEPTDPFWSIFGSNEQHYPFWSIFWSNYQKYPFSSIFD